MQNFDHILAGTSRTILEGLEYIRCRKIKTTNQRKRMIVELWNHTLDVAISTTESPVDRAILKGYYGCITASSLEGLDMEQTYIFVKKFAMIMAMEEVWKDE